MGPAFSWSPLSSTFSERPRKTAPPSWGHLEGLGLDLGEKKKPLTKFLTQSPFSQGWMLPTVLCTEITQAKNLI